MSDSSVLHLLGDVHEYMTHQEFNLRIPAGARPVGVICKGQNYQQQQLWLVCVESGKSNPNVIERKFVATSGNAFGDALMYIGAVQLTKAHTHQVDIGQSVLYSDPHDPNYQSQPHSHAHHSVTDAVSPQVSDPLMVFEVSKD